MISCLERGSEAAERQIAMEKTLEVGDVVVFMDEVNCPHNALVTAVHGEISRIQWREDIEGLTGHWNHEIIEGKGPVKLQIPCINLLYLSGNPNKQDPYGRQCEHESSVVYKEESTAHGNYFMWTGETPNPIANTKS